MKRKTISRERILRQAFILFQKYGYTKTTTRMIAQAAGVNEATIFNNFTSKANLFHEIYFIVPPSVEQMPVQDLTNGRDLYHDIHLLVDANLHLIINNFPMYRFSMPLIDPVDEDLHARSYANIQSINQFIEKYFTFLGELGIVRSIDTEIMAKTIQWTILISSFQLVRQMPDEEHPDVSYDEEATRNLVDQLTDFLYGTLLPGPDEGAR